MFKKNHVLEAVKMDHVKTHSEICAEINKAENIPAFAQVYYDVMVDAITRELMDLDNGLFRDCATELCNYMLDKPWRVTPAVKELGLSYIAPDHLINNFVSDKYMRGGSACTYIRSIDAYADIKPYMTEIPVIAQGDLENIALHTHGLDSRRKALLNRQTGSWDKLTAACVLMYHRIFNGEHDPVLGSAEDVERRYREQAIDVARKFLTLDPRKTTESESPTHRLYWHRLFFKFYSNCENLTDSEAETIRGMFSESGYTELQMSGAYSGLRNDSLVLI